MPPPPPPIERFHPCHSIPAIVQTLNSSHEADKVVFAVQVLAAASDPESHALLESRLKSAQFVNELDPPDKPVSSRLDMKIWKPLRTLSENKVSSAKAVLESLTESPLYLQNINRADLLLKPPSPSGHPGLG